MALANANKGDFEKDLVEALLADGKLERQGLDRARRLGEGRGETLHRILSKLGLVSERDMAEVLAKVLGLSLVREADLPAAPLLDGKLGARFLKRWQVVPLAQSDEALTVAMADPLDQYAHDALRLIAKSELRISVAEPSLIERAIERLYGEEAGDRGVEEVGLDNDDMELDVERLKDLASEAPVVRLVNQMITRAVDLRASDIHMEAFENSLRLRYRVDGVLQETDPPPNRLRAAIVSRIKIMAKLNIAERRLPQDGRIKLAIRGKPIDLRISIVPAMHGEGVVMRILDRESVSLDFAALGITGASLARLEEVLERPNGIYLVTGPTGSGKTTTLYAALSRLNSPDKKLLTVEDPVEYQLDGVNQVQVKPSIGLTFAHSLRAFLRQDPDILMIGEIRDKETAEIAVQAALTGHLVLSTLHTNDAAGSLTRLLDMGVDDYLLTSTVIAVSAQRLVRTLCPHCREPQEALPELVEQLGLRRYSRDERITLYHPRGCERCEQRGFQGRTSVIETLVMSDRVRQLVLRQAEVKDLLRAAVEDGMQTMYEDGMTKAIQGVTTVEEVLRVTRDI